MRRYWPTGSCGAKNKKIEHIIIICYIVIFLLQVSKHEDHVQGEF
jgi:hypothetical protein